MGFETTGQTSRSEYERPGLCRDGTGTAKAGKAKTDSMNDELDYGDMLIEWLREKQEHDQF